MFNPTFLQISPAWMVATIIFVLLIIFYLIGHSVRVRRHLKTPELALSDTGKLSTVLIGLLGFLLAFTFGMSNSRYDKRRDVTVQEANDIGTAFLRTKVYPDSMQKVLTPLFKEYIEHRISFRTVGMQLDSMRYHYLQAEEVGQKIWTEAISYCHVNAQLVIASQLLPELNAMLDIAITQRALGEATVPDSILCFLFALAFCGAFLLGYESKGAIDWVILLVFAIMISITIFTIIDLDRPRSGLIRIDLEVQKIIDLRHIVH